MYVPLRSSFSSIIDTSAGPVHNAPAILHLVVLLSYYCCLASGLESDVVISKRDAHVSSSYSSSVLFLTVNSNKNYYCFDLFGQ